MKPGVVTGQRYLDVVEAAKQGGYALPAVNVVGQIHQRGPRSCGAREEHVVVQLSNGGAQFFAGKGYPDSFEAKVLGAISARSLPPDGGGIRCLRHTPHRPREPWARPWVEAMLDHSERHYERTGQPYLALICWTSQRSLSRPTSSFAPRC